MSLFLVLEDFQTATVRLSAGELVDDGQHSITALRAAGAALVAHVVGMDATIKSYLDARGTRPAQPTPSLVSSLAAVGFFGNGHSSSGLLSGGQLARVDATHFSVAAGFGVIIDDVTDPATPISIPVSFGPFPSVVPSGLTTHIFTDLLIDETGALVQLPGQVPTPGQRRGFIALGKIVHSDLATIILANPLPVVGLQPAQGVWDIMQALGPLNAGGNIFGAAGANLLLSKSAGEILEAGANFEADNQNPSLVPILADPAASPIFYHHRDGSGGFTISAPQTAVDPNFYDDGSGTLAAVPSNRWSIQRIRVATAGPVYPMYYGQVLYNSFATAVAAIHDEVAGEPFLNAATVFRGWLVVRGGTTDLSDALNNAFFAAPKFGDGGASSGGVSDHGLLAGLADDDHIQYLLRSERLIELLDGFSSGNRYDGAVNGLGGVATGFLVGVLVEAKELNGSAGQALVANIATGVAGWALGIEAAGAFSAQFIDTVGGFQAATGPTFDPLTTPASAGPIPKHWLLVLQVTQNGANNEIRLWCNGLLSVVALPLVAYQPRTGLVQVGAGPFGNVAVESAVGGFCYLEGTLTDDEIRAWTYACMAAGDIVDGGAGWDVGYSVKLGTPGASWLPTFGSGPTLTEVGSVGSLTRLIPLWG